MFLRHGVHIEPQYSENPNRPQLGEPLNS
uniref:Uncharacterized protein n=1 Tax=Anguilla anguilla TaxID=7936 RepID=A0A0E9P656_ANGAN